MKSHKTDWTSLIFGLGFVGIAAIALIQEIAEFDINGAWIVPGIATLMGLGLVLGRRKRESVPSTETEQAENRNL